VTQNIKEGFKFLLALYFACVTFVGFVVAYPFLLVFLSNKKWYPFGHTTRKIWGWWLFIAGGLQVKQVEETPIDWQQAYVVTSNHTSYLDIPTLTVKLPMFINFMAKIELSRIPLFGIFFRTIDIAVDRKNVRQSVWAFHQAKEQLMKDNRSIVIFPEGTIPTTTPKMGRFKEGAFRLAIETQKPILPVTILGNWIALPDQGKVRFKPTRILQFVHTPISTQGLTLNDVDDLKQKVYRIIEQKLAEHGYIK
jgi:1-acyl-sn-glycerol-3-phosphate acyltransferase